MLRIELFFSISLSLRPIVTPMISTRIKRIFNHTFATENSTFYKCTTFNSNDIAFFKLFIPFSYLPRDPSFHSKLLLTCMLFIIHGVLLIRKETHLIFNQPEKVFSFAYSYSILFNFVFPYHSKETNFNLLTIDSFIYFSKNFHTFQPPKIPSFPKKKKKFIKLRNR